jgi:hypothetical protein
LFLLTEASAKSRVRLALRSTSTRAEALFLPVDVLQNKVISPANLQKRHGRRATIPAIPEDAVAPQIR